MKVAARSAAVRAATKLNVWVYRRTNGRVGGKGMGGLPLLLLHDDRYLVVGTGMGGSKQTPQWFRNLAVVGTGRIRVGEQDHDVDARVANAAERARLWTVIAARAPHFDKWQTRIGRMFPIAVLTNRSAAA